MNGMAFTHEEEQRIRKMEAQMQSMYNVIVGDPMTEQPGFAKRLNNIEERVGRLEAKIDEHNRLFQSVKRSWKHILLALGIGILIGGLVFGWLTWRDAVEGVKIIK